LGCDAAAYVDRRTLIEGGVDVLLVETCQDILQAKCAVAACFDAMKTAGRRVSLQVQVTLEATARCCWGPRLARH